ncbi:hypothetical protein J6R97_08645 [bacterium]|nr:hypothetical protein [bacterium]
MQKIKFIFIVFFLTQSYAFANLNDIFIADIQYDWLNKSEIEKETIVSEVREIIFKDGEIKALNDFKTNFKDKMKDKNYKEHYLIASAGRKEFKDYNISAFYYKRQKHIYMYALQDKKDLSKIFYYDALGNLRYVDFNYGDYPIYPYYTIQYSIAGKPISVIYNVSKDNQYLYQPDGVFKGVWYKHNLYDKHSKVILTRTLY